MSNTTIALGLPVFHTQERAYDYVMGIDRRYDREAGQRNRQTAYRWFIDNHGADKMVPQRALSGTPFDHNLNWQNEIELMGHMRREVVNDTIFYGITASAVEVANLTGLLPEGKPLKLREAYRAHLNNLSWTGPQYFAGEDFYRERRDGTQRARTILAWQIKQIAENADLRTHEGQQAVLAYHRRDKRHINLQKLCTSWHDKVFNNSSVVQTKDWEPITARQLFDWAGKQWSDDLSKFHDVSMIVGMFHVLHVSTDDPMQVAYYPTLKHILEDRPMRTRMGKYMAAYASMMGFTDANVKKVVDAYQAEMTKRNNITLNFAAHDDGDKWVDVYRDGPSSCMSGDDSWCVRVYAHSRSQLRLAYLTDDDGDVIARAIVRCRDLGAREDEHGYLRVYPDPEGDREGKMLLMMLKDAGYGERINLDGCLLAYEEDDEGIVCPYIDVGNGGSQSVSEVHREGQMYLKVGGGEHRANNTSGVIETIYCTCEDCHDRIRSENDAYSVQDGDRTVCEECRDNHYEYAYFGSRGNQDYFHSDNVIFCESDHDYYVEEDAHYYNVYQCQESYQWYHRDVMVCVDDEWYHQDHVQKLDYEHNGEDYALIDDAKALPDGKYCHEDDYAEIMESEYADAEV